MIEPRSRWFLWGLLAVSVMNLGLFISNVVLAHFAVAAINIAGICFTLAALWLWKQTREMGRKL